jgi:hypothetical protein
MERLLRMDREEFFRRGLEEARQTLEQIAEAVDDAPDGNVINGSEMQVREVVLRFGQAAYEVALQSRIDSTESSFSPSEGRIGQAKAEQGAQQPQHADGERPDQSEADSVARQRRGK